MNWPLRDDSIRAITVYTETVYSNGLVYFVQAGDTSGPVKIGYVNSEDALEKRMESLQIANYQPLAIIRLIYGLSQTERWFHKHYHRLQIRGEWYAFDSAMMTDSPPALEARQLNPAERGVLETQLRIAEAKQKGFAGSGYIRPDLLKRFTWGK